MGDQQAISIPMAFDFGRELWVELGPTQERRLFKLWAAFDATKDGFFATLQSR